MAMRLLSTVLILSASALTASAADLPVRSAPPPPVAPMATGWAGLYAGFHVGYSSGAKSSLSTNADARASKSVGRGECQTSNGTTVPPNEGGANPTTCTAPVQNTFSYQGNQSFPATFTPGAAAFCTGFSPGNPAIPNNQNQCTGRGGTWVPATSNTCVGGPGGNVTYPNINSSGACNAASTANVCTYGSTVRYDLNNSNACAAAAGTSPSTNQWVTNSDLFSSSAMAAASSIGSERTQFGGFSIGYNFQTGRIVYGVEGDFSWIHNARDDRYSISEVNLENVEGPGQSQVPLYTNMSTEAFGKFGVNHFATLRLRLGYDFDDRFLVFVTGGLAGGDISMIGRVAYSGDWGIGRGQNDPRAVFGRTDTFDESGWKWGYTLGAGINYKLSENIILGLTYLYVDLGKHSASSSFAFTDSLSRGNDNPNAPNNGFQVAANGSAKASLDASFHTVRLSAQVRFTTGGNNSIVASY